MAKKKTNGTPQLLKKIEQRLNHLETLIRAERRVEKRETIVEPWRFLVRREHPWRKQLYVKGRNLTARQLVGGIKANRMDEKKAAANYHLPVAAIREALAYVQKNRRLLETETEIERLMLQREGEFRVPEPVS